MFAALAEGASHPAAAWLGLGTAGLAAVVVAMVWSVNARQIQLAELLTRRQFPVASEAGTAGRVVRTPAAGRNQGVPRASRPPRRAGAARCIEGPDEVIAGQQARYRFAVGPAPDRLAAVGAGRPRARPRRFRRPAADRRPAGDLTIIARVREGLTERRATKSVTAVP